MSPHKDTSSPTTEYAPKFSIPPSSSSTSHVLRSKRAMLNGMTSTLPSTYAAATNIKSTKQEHSSTSLASTSLPTTTTTTLTSKRPLVPGAYVPTVVFFDPATEDLDLGTISAHAVRLAQSGVAGITTQGSNGEAAHLTHAERRTVTRTTRSALDAAGFTNVPIIVGCGAQSTRETIELCHDALESGGDYALVLPPSYYKPFLDRDALMQFFTDVASASPVPILIYNYPGAASGTDLDSDAIIQLATHPNIVGCKLTCGNTGKLARIAAATNAASPCSTSFPSSSSPSCSSSSSSTPSTTPSSSSSSLAASSPSTSPSSSSSPPSSFMCLGGSADFTLQALIAGGSGTISGLANIAPKSCVRVIDLFTAGRVDEARALQAIVARADWAAIKSGIVGTKCALQMYYGYGGYARRPLPRVDGKEVAELTGGFEEIVAVEGSL